MDFLSPNSLPPRRADPDAAERRPSTASRTAWTHLADIHAQGAPPRAPKVDSPQLSARIRASTHTVLSRMLSVTIYALVADRRRARKLTAVNSRVPGHPLGERETCTPPTDALAERPGATAKHIKSDRRRLITASQLATACPVAGDRLSTFHGSMIATRIDGGGQPLAPAPSGQVGGSGPKLRSLTRSGAAAASSGCMSSETTLVSIRIIRRGRVQKVEGGRIGPRAAGRARCRRAPRSGMNAPPRDPPGQGRGLPPCAGSRGPLLPSTGRGRRRAGGGGASNADCGLPMAQVFGVRSQAAQRRS